MTYISFERLNYTLLLIAQYRYVYTCPYMPIARKEVVNNVILKLVCVICLNERLLRIESTVGRASH